MQNRQRRAAKKRARARRRVRRRPATNGAGWAARPAAADAALFDIHQSVGQAS